MTNKSRDEILDMYIAALRKYDKGEMSNEELSQIKKYVAHVLVSS